MNGLQTRYLETKNGNMTADKIKFEDEGHQYWAFSPYYSDWVSTKYGIGGAPMVSTTTMLGKHFNTDMDKIALMIWNNPKFRFQMEMDMTYQYYGCKGIDDIKAIWSKGAIAGTRMHENFEDFVNLIEYDKDHPPAGSNLSIDPIIGVYVTNPKCKKKSKLKTEGDESIDGSIVERRSWDDHDGLGMNYYDHVIKLQDYNFHLRNDTASYLYAQAKLEGYNEKMYLFMFLDKFKLLDPESGINFHRTEMLMWHNVLHISGMIDALLYDKNTDSYIIVDWKRCKGGVKGDPNPNNPRTKPVEQLAPSGRGQGLPAFEMLRNNNANKYGCQLTLYKQIFENMTGKRISGMFLVVVDHTKIGKSSALDIQEVPLTKFDECIRQVFENRAREMLGSFEKTLDDDHHSDLIKFLPDDDDPGPSITDVIPGSPLPIKRKLVNTLSLSHKKSKK